MRNFFYLLQNTRGVLYFMNKISFKTIYKTWFHLNKCLLYMGFAFTLVLLEIYRIFIYIYRLWRHKIQLFWLRNEEYPFIEQMCKWVFGRKERERMRGRRQEANFDTLKLTLVIYSVSPTPCSVTTPNYRSSNCEYIFKKKAR